MWISAHCAALRERLIGMIEAGDAGALREAEVLRPNGSGHQARFISLRHPKATAWKAALFEGDVITDARDDVLRIGIGLYHDAADLDALCQSVRRTLSA